MKYLILGGQNRADSLGKAEWKQFELAVAMLVDTESNSSRRLLEYESPLDVTAPEDARAVLFKAGTLQGDRLYLCTQTEVLVYSYPDMTQVRYLSLPCFNDLHHVRPGQGENLLVVSTGLDMVFEIDRDDRVVQEWATVDGSGWERFDRDTDYRTWSTTKPHISHPNYVFDLNGENWVTRFEQRDAICLDDRSRSIAIDIQGPHDGVCFDGRVYFTTVDGHVVIADARTLERLAVYDLNEIEGVDYSLGWCRGLLVIDERRVMVGYSRIRPTRIRENIRWVRHKLGMQTSGLRPSRIAIYDLYAGILEWEYALEDAGLNAIFSIHRG